MDAERRSRLLLHIAKAMAEATGLVWMEMSVYSQRLYLLFAEAAIESIQSYEE